MSIAQKTPLARTLNIFATNKAVAEIEKRGQGLPGKVKSIAGAIVTIDFLVSDLTLQPVEMPVASPEYIRLPIQVGDLGVALPASVYLGGVSGLGGGIADTTLRANLSTLIWIPLGNVDFSAVDGNAVVIYGPNGVVLKDKAGHTIATLTPAGWEVNAQTTINLHIGGGSSIVMNSTGITLTSNGHTLEINATGIVLDGKIFLLHDHLGVTVGTGVSGPVGP